MANEWRISFEEFATNLTHIFERLRRTDETPMVETGEDTIIVHRAGAGDAGDTLEGSFTPPPADDEEFRAAAGSWGDVDTDALMENIYAGRERISDRPSVNTFPTGVTQDSQACGSGGACSTDQNSHVLMATSGTLRDGW